MTDNNSYSSQRNSDRDIPKLSEIFPDTDVIRRIGSGGMSTVYLIRELETDRLSALKILRSDVSTSHQSTERFLLEARTQEELGEHPRIVSVYRYGSEQPIHYIQMEYLRGGSLKDYIVRGISTKDAVRITLQICEALEYAHDKGVIHRDIKPGNILLDENDDVKIGDFGLVKRQRSTPDVSDLTVTGMVLSSGTYTSPEQKKSSKRVDARTDIYSLGIVLYEMLSGRKPGTISLPLAKLPVRPARLNSIVRKMTDANPDQRFQSISEVKSELVTIQKRPSRARLLGTAWHKAAMFLVMAGLAFSAHSLWPKPPSYLHQSNCRIFGLPPPKPALNGKVYLIAHENNYGSAGFLSNQHVKYGIDEDGVELSVTVYQAEITNPHSMTGSTRVSYLDLLLSESTTETVFHLNANLAVLRLHVMADNKYAFQFGYKTFTTEKHQHACPIWLGDITPIPKAHVDVPMAIRLKLFSNEVRVMFRQDGKVLTEASRIYSSGLNPTSKVGYGIYAGNNNQGRANYTIGDFSVR